MVNRFVNSFTSQVARRGLRAVGTPKMIVPVLIGFVREFNRQMQWGNKAVWNQRMEKAKELYAEFQARQNEVSPVYRFRGGSKTVRPHLSHETVRDKIRDPSAHPSLSIKKYSFRSKSFEFDSSTLLLGSLGFVIIASIAGPSIAKKVNYVDPLDALELNLKESGQYDDLRGIQLRH